MLLEFKEPIPVNHEDPPEAIHVGMTFSPTSCYSQSQSLMKRKCSILSAFYLQHLELHESQTQSDTLTAARG